MERQVRGRKSNFDAVLGGDKTAGPAERRDHSASNADKQIGGRLFRERVSAMIFQIFGSRCGSSEVTRACLLF
jgi:hypothetical protein